MAQIVEEKITAVRLNRFSDGRDLKVKAYGWFNLRNVLYGMRDEIDKAIKLVEQKEGAIL